MTIECNSKEHVALVITTNIKRACHCYGGYERIVKIIRSFLVVAYDEIK